MTQTKQKVKLILTFTAGLELMVTVPMASITTWVYVQGV